MKCKCGGDTTATKVTIERRNKKYRVSLFKCKKCEREFNVSKIHVFLK